MMFWRVYNSFEIIRRKANTHTTVFFSFFESTETISAIAKSKEKSLFLESYDTFNNYFGILTNVVGKP